MPSNDPTDQLNLVNAGYVADLYERYRRDPTSVEPDWRSLFDSGAGGFEPVAVPAATEGGNGAAQESEAPAAPTPAQGQPTEAGPRPRPHPREQRRSRVRRLAWRRT